MGVFIITISQRLGRGGGLSAKQSRLRMESPLCPPRKTPVVSPNGFGESSSPAPTVEREREIDFLSQIVLGLHNSKYLRPENVLRKPRYT